MNATTTAPAATLDRAEALPVSHRRALRTADADGRITYLPARWASIRVMMDRGLIVRDTDTGYTFRITELGADYARILDNRDSGANNDALRALNAKQAAEQIAKQG